MASDYKSTLNLPHTNFAMKAQLSQREPQILQQWQKMDIYRQMCEKRADCPLFVLSDGPPYANGAIHIGHAVNKTLKDIVLKHKALQGFSTPYVPGWDCHGLPIELNVEKKLGKPGAKVSAEVFRQACRDYAQSQVDSQRAEFERLGVFGEWDNAYLTMNPRFEANILRSLAIVIERGHLQRGYKPVHWCFDCRSALAEAEVVHQDKLSPSIDVCFEVLDRHDMGQRFGLSELPDAQHCSVVIWTTTPWTLPANHAVALHSELLYKLVKCNERLLIVAESLLESFISRCQMGNYQCLGRCQGHELQGLQLQHPLEQRMVPIVLGEHVTVDAGTGCVHTAPAHGVDDYALGQQYRLPMSTPLQGNGCFIQDYDNIGGLYFTKAVPVIIEQLQVKGALLHHSELQHSYPHCWRHKTPLIYRATPQWFVSMEANGLLTLALKAIKSVKWLPTNSERRMKAMLEDRPDWCISRQRTWGVPLPLFLHKESDELHPDTIALIEKVAQQVEQHGIEAWYQLDKATLLGDHADDYVSSPDVLDVWFDSGVSHFCVLEDRDNLHSPADLVLEGTDQHRGWFQTSLLTSCAMTGQAPYRQVVTHGFAVDSHGRKMSKSVGNVIAPEKIMNSLGADILRLWVASTDYHHEMVVSDEIFKHSSETYRRIRNTVRFLLANTHDFSLADDGIDGKQMLALDVWALNRLRCLQQQVVSDYEHYHFHLVVQKIHNFCSLEMGSFYLDIIKDRQYTMAANSTARRSAQTVMFHVIEVLVRLLAPICPFTSEEIWQHMSGDRAPSIFLSDAYSLPVSPSSLLTDQEWQQLMLVRDAVNKEVEQLRSHKVLGSNLEAQVVLYVDAGMENLLRKLGDELRFVLITSEAIVKPLSQAQDAKETTIEGLKLVITASSQKKCHRCWHRRADVGVVKQHPQLCGRCVVNIEGQGESRCYA